MGADEAEIVFAGDAMQHAGQIDAARRSDGTYDYSGYFTALQPYISGADYAVVNLETPLGGRPYSGYPMFCAPDAYASALVDAGFDFMLLANNHMLDRRDRGLVRTLDVLDSIGVPHAGVWRNAGERSCNNPVIREVNGFRIAFLNYTYGTNGIEPQGDVVVDYIDRQIIAADIERSRALGAEIIAACVHWGDEYRLLPNASQRSLADWLVEQGVDMIIGGHPHVIQPMEMRRNEITGRPVLLVYSLGNFISNMKTADTRGGAMVKVRLMRDRYGKAHVADASYRLVFTVPPVDGCNYRAVPVEACPSVRWQPACDAFVRNAESIFNRHNRSVPRDTVSIKPVEVIDTRY